MLSLAGPAAGGVLENLSWCQILGSCWILGLCQSKVKVWDLREKKKGSNYPRFKARIVNMTS